MSRSTRTALFAAIGLALSVFVCHKQVLAAPIVAADPVAHTLTIMLPTGEPHTFAPAAGFFARSTPAPGDYFVVYDDGYQSHSPKAVFEAGYHAATDGMTFGDAIAAMKQGKRVARAGWNGKGMWLALSCGETREIPAASFWSPHNKAHAEAQGGTAKVLPSITMKTATGEILMGWLASQTDMLAEDWCVVA